ncbi:MAG: HPr family phosphocarrier protein [Lentisphaerae bacterium]|nr:HPr family phosphocarrier protein [Lentisphaerota bacterium]
MSTVSSRFVVSNRHGLHARPAALFVRAAGRYQADIRVKTFGNFVDGKSILDLLSINAGHGTSLTVVAEGRDAPEAMEHIGHLFVSAFGEKAPRTGAGSDLTSACLMG